MAVRDHMGLLKGILYFRNFKAHAAYVLSPQTSESLPWLVLFKVLLIDSLLMFMSIAKLYWANKQSMIKIVKDI